MIMLVELSIKNLKKSLKDYSIYFFTLILAVCIFYIFNALGTQSAMMELSQTKSNIIDTMNLVLSSMSVVVSFILAFLIVYASSFLIKKRKKEFGIYLLLGMNKVSIAKILFYETLLIGFVSLVVGLILGIILSQFMSLLVASLFRANMDRFVFVISTEAIIKTLIYFTVIYIIDMILNTLHVTRSKLIDLILASKKKETPILKNPIFSIILFVISVIVLVYAYLKVTVYASTLDTTFSAMIPFICGIITTFTIFWSISSLFIYLTNKFPRLYHHRLNNFVYGQLGHQFNRSVFASGIICLLLFVTICVLSSAFSLKSYKDSILDEVAPISLSLSKEMSDNITIEEVLEETNILTDHFKDMLEVSTYTLPEVNNLTIYGDYGQKILTNDPTFEAYLTEPLSIIHVSDYNRVASMYQLTPLTLDDHEYAIVADYPNSVRMYNEGLKVNQTITINGETYTAAYDTCQKGYLMMSYDAQNQGFIVVSDDTPLTQKQVNYFLTNYDQTIEAASFDKNLYERLNPENASWSMIIPSLQTNIYDDSIGSSGVVIFVALYLGFISMISASAILALKQMSDCIDQKNQYQILRKIGTSKKEIHHALFMQCAFFFGLPLILAIIHSIFGMQVCYQMLNIYNSDGILPAIIVTALLIVGIYGAYFILTYQMSKRIIYEEE